MKERGKNGTFSFVWHPQCQWQRDVYTRYAFHYIVLQKTKHWHYGILYSRTLSNHNHMVIIMFYCYIYWVNYFRSVTSINHARMIFDLNSISVCYDKLGVEDGTIPDDKLEASAVFGQYVASKGRLNGASFWGAPDHVDDGITPWIQADIGYQTYVSGVMTQGSVSHWITSIKVSTFSITTGDPEIFIMDEDGNALVS